MAVYPFRRPRLARGVSRSAAFSVAVVMLAACGPGMLVACGSGSSGGSPATPTPGAPTATPAPSVAPTPSPEPTSSGLALRLEEVASGLEQPVFLTAPQGAGDRLYVVEQVGRIRVLVAGSLREGPFLDLSEEVSCCGERGLLGLAFHPDFGENGRFFVDYTDGAGDTVIAEYVALDPDRAEPEAVRTLLRIDQPFPNHNGGMVAFGPDGSLWIGTGDGGGAGDPLGVAQDPSSKLGKLLRIDVDRYPEPPPGNLPGADPDVWAVGLRNPWRFSFDRATGDLYVGDVGQNRFEEIDVTPASVLAAAGGGPNYGWPIFEGLACFDPPQDCDPAGLTAPVYTYDRDSGCSVTGGYVYRGTGVPELTGRYLFGDFCSNRIWSFEAAALSDQPADVIELTDAIDGVEGVQGLASFGEDAAGEIYVTSLDGGVFRLTAR